MFHVGQFITLFREISKEIDKPLGISLPDHVIRINSLTSKFNSSNIRRTPGKTNEWRFIRNSVVDIDIDFSRGSLIKYKDKGMTIRESTSNEIFLYYYIKLGILL